MEWIRSIQIIIMLTQIFDFKQAEYKTFAEVKREEIEQADVLIIKEYVDGGIYHSQKIRWLGDISGISDKYGFIRSEKEKKAVAQNKQAFEAEGFSFQTKPVTNDLFNEFVEVYQQTTLQKKRADPPNLKEQILNKLIQGIPAFIIGMYKDGKLVSGLAFSIRKGQIFVSLGAKQRFNDKRGGVGGVLEIELIDFCLKNNLGKISHGLSENPVGIFSAAGEFEFKARYGHSAFPEREWQTMFLLNKNAAQSDLIFIAGCDSHLCQKVFASSQEDVAPKYKTRFVPNAVQFSLEKEINKHRIKFGLSTF
jgi:hypothetical protein